MEGEKTYPNDSFGFQGKTIRNEVVEKVKVRNCAKGTQVCFKVKLQQERSFDFKHCFKVKDLFQMLLLSRSYCDGNDMLRGKWWFSLDRGKKNFTMIDVPYEGQTTKSLIHSLPGSRNWVSYSEISNLFF